MYNRYVPQNDGTYTRKPIPEQRRDPAPPIPKEPPRPAPPPLTPPCQNCIHQAKPKPRASSQPLKNFWKQLLPKDFATEDLLIILLLLLMAGDCPDEQNSALLTLALYLFL